MSWQTKIMPRSDSVCPNVSTAHLAKSTYAYVGKLSPDGSVLGQESARFHFDTVGSEYLGRLRFRLVPVVQLPSVEACKEAVPNPLCVGL
jgi:hypothetical protein